MTGTVVSQENEGPRWQQPRGLVTNFRLDFPRTRVTAHPQTRDWGSRASGRGPEAEPQVAVRQLQGAGWGAAEGPTEPYGSLRLPRCPEPSCGEGTGAQIKSQRVPSIPRCLLGSLVRPPPCTSRPPLPCSQCGHVVTGHHLASKRGNNGGVYFIGR